MVLDNTEKFIPKIEYFTTSNQNLKIYQRQGHQLPGPILSRPDLSVNSLEKRTVEEKVPITPESSFAKNNSLLNLPVGLVIVNEKYDIQEINLQGRRLLGIHSSAIGEDFVHLAELLPTRELANVITRTLRKKIVSTLPEVQVPHVLTGEPTYLQLSFHPQTDNTNVVIVITDVTQSHKVNLELKNANDKLNNLEATQAQALAEKENFNKEIHNFKKQLDTALLDRESAREEAQNYKNQLDSALKKNKEETDELIKRHTTQMGILVANNEKLLATNEEHLTNNTELRQLSQDFQLKHEEAQAAIEETATLNEEMQATNEEMETLNEEMQAMVEELNTSNSDLAARGMELEKLASSLDEQRHTSERERAQLALILASMQDAVLVVKPDGVPLLTNNAYKELFEKRGAVQCLDEAGETLPDNETPIARAARGENFSMVFKLLLEDQSIRWCEAVGQPIDALYGGVVVIRDSTERVIADKALQDSNLRVTRILESISDGFFALDSAAVFTYINHAAEESVIKGRQELVGKNIWEEFPELVDSIVYIKLQEALKERKPVEYETVSTFGGKWLGVKAYPTDEGGLSVYFRDISERKLEEKQRLESLGMLAGGIAHDFNNVLAIITGNLGLIKLELEATGQWDDILSLVSDVENAAYRARSLTKQLLTFSNGGAPVKKLLQLPPLLKEWLHFTLIGATTEYQLDCDEDLWLVEIDEGQFSQVINNLAMNSVHAMPAGGELTVKAENFVLNGNSRHLNRPSGNYVKIDLKDHGSGIQPELISRIFEPYFTTRTHGRGLGLAMVYSIVNRHGGFIEVESVVGKGTTFTIYLPAAQNQSKPAKLATSTVPPPIEEPSGEIRRILVLEDEEMLQTVLLKLLKTLGYAAMITSQGSETVAEYQKALKEGNPYSVLILDLLVPEGKGGQEVLIELLKLDPDVKAIVSSGYNADPIMAHYKEQGFKGILSKPYTVEQLTQVLNEVIASK